VLLWFDNVKSSASNRLAAGGVIWTSETSIW
jgi:hypothetical protein